MRLVAYVQSAQSIQSDTGLSADATFTADIIDESAPGLDQAMKGVDALVISTSAKPQIVLTSLPKVLHIYMQIWMYARMSNPTFPTVAVHASGCRARRAFIALQLSQLLKIGDSTGGARQCSMQ